LPKNTDSFYLAIKLLDSTKVGQLVMSDRQLGWATKFCDKIAQFCCMSDMGRRLRDDNQSWKQETQT